MDFKKFSDELVKVASESKINGVGVTLAQKVSADALRFIDDNFRSQSWEGTGWEKSSENGTTLVKTGALKRSFNSDINPGVVRIYTNVKYARRHNEGFKGSESVRAHKRAVYTKLGKGRKKKTGATEVKAHTRMANVKQRQFIPYEGHESPTLNNKVERTIRLHIDELFKDIKK